MNLYNLKQLAPNKFQLAKFDEDFNVAAIYNIEPHRGDWSCDCPANQRTVVLKKCKHRRMMPLMLGACNTDRFFDPNTGNWLQPLGDIDRPQAKPSIASEEEIIAEAKQVLGLDEASSSELSTEDKADIIAAKQAMLEPSVPFEKVKVDLARFASSGIRRR